MSGRAAHARRTASRRPADSPTGDGIVYLTFIVLGLVLAGFLWLMMGPDGRPFLAGYIVAVLWLVNTSAIRAYNGVDIEGWRRALARIPLAPAGFGRRGARPVEAAKGQPAARQACIISVVVSVAIAGAVFWYVARAFA
ncbi:MAG: hypothetical protein AB8G96_15100 [Phycisphaerales bacterium]